MTEEENRTDEAAPDLPPEDDNGNTEYKLKLCGLTMYKVVRRTTQMAFRLTVSICRHCFYRSPRGTESYNSFVYAGGQR